MAQWQMLVIMQIDGLPVTGSLYDPSGPEMGPEVVNYACSIDMAVKKALQEGWEPLSPGLSTIPLPVGSPLLAQQEVQLRKVLVFSFRRPALVELPASS